MTAAYKNLFDQPGGRQSIHLAAGHSSGSLTAGSRYQLSDYVNGQDYVNGKEPVKPPRRARPRVSRCPIRQELLEEYNRIFNSWAAGEEERNKELSDPDSERLAQAQVEEAHQKLERHQQSCPACQRSR